LLKNIGRAFVFILGLAAVVAIVISIVSFASQSAPGGEGDSPSLGGLSLPNDALIGLYLDTKAADLTQPAGSDDTPVLFTVASGETVKEIATRLEGDGLISDAQLFRRYVQYHGLDAGIEAGEFTLRRTMTVPEIARALQEGQRPEQVVTIPEGLRLEQVAAVVAEQTSIPQDAFLVLVTTGWSDMGLGSGFLAGVPPTATLEGFLFPETYRLPEDATARDLLTRMLETFDERVTSEMQAAAANRGLDVYELIALASIVEREAVLDEERPLIAGVYANRLDAGWFLSACPTVQYGMGGPEDWWPPLTLDDLDRDSLYNTYRNLGLPPGPICSPGLASIQASAYPADTEYYFFLVDCNSADGSHLFATTEQEHLSNYDMCGGSIP
jgi:UPF0755 protein